MPRFGLFIPLCLACIATPADASEWWWVWTTGDRPNLRLGFVDKESETADYLERMSAWTFSIYQTPRSDGVRKAKALYRYNCKTRTSTLLNFINYGNNDRLIDSISVKSYDQEERVVVPDTIGEAEWQFVCQGKADVDKALPSSPEEFSAFVFKMDK